MAFQQPRDYQALFRFLGDPSLQQKYHSTAPTHTHRAFSPNFDVHETQKEYILEGELPGLSDKSKVNIEFTDSQTLLVRGKVERSTYTDEHGRRRSLMPTVEDEDDVNKQEVEVAAAGTEAAVKKDKNVIKYWVSERSVGEFQRNFTFPGVVDLDQVKASLEHGILRIVVPKKVQVGSRKIEIN